MASPLSILGGDIMLSKLQLLTGVVYTELKPSEVRSYLQGGAKGGTIYAFTDTTKATKIIVAVHAIEYVYEVQVAAT
jgi:hypothetical protein